MELYMKLGLREISSIINTMAKYKVDGIEFANGSFELNGIKYDYLLDDNNLILKSSDGRSMNIIIDADTKEFKDYLNRPIKVVSHEVNINYYLPNGDTINLNNSLGLEEGYRGFDGVQRHDLISGMRNSLVGKDGKVKSSFSINLDTVYLDDEHKKYSFGVDGISYDNKVVSLDGNELLAINANKLDDINEMKTFSGSREKFILSRIIHADRDLHPITKRIIEEETFKKIDRIEKEAEEIRSFDADEVKKLRKVISMRNDMMKNFNKNVFVEKELSELEKHFNKEYSKQKDIKIKKYTRI